MPGAGGTKQCLELNDVRQERLAKRGRVGCNASCRCTLNLVEEEARHS